MAKRKLKMTKKAIASRRRYRAKRGGRGGLFPGFKNAPASVKKQLVAQFKKAFTGKRVTKR